MSNSVLAILFTGLTLGAASLPNPAVDAPKSDKKTEVAVVAGGCFWGIEAVFDSLKGVSDASSGYTGGSKANAHYRNRQHWDHGARGRSVQITFDPNQISYGQILKIFFTVHDSTEINRQGPDDGSQYRSEIFYTSEEQKKIAVAYIEQLNATKAFHGRIATKGRAAQGVLSSGRSSSSGLRKKESQSGIHCLQRSSEGRSCAPGISGDGKGEQMSILRSNRRGFLAVLGGLAPVAVVWAGSETSPKKVKIAQFDAAGKPTGVVELEKIEKPESEWKKQLTTEQFEVTRKEGTERPFTGKYANNHADGLYSCICCCGTVLFDSKTKFESGTGWPSFWIPIAKENVGQAKSTRAGVWSAMKLSAPAAGVILGTCSMTARRLHTCAIA